MNRIRTIFVALVILLVSLTMVMGVATAAPLLPDVGGDLPAEPLPGDDFLETDDADPPGPPGGDDEGDPDDGVLAKGGSGTVSQGISTDSWSGMTWFEILQMVTTIKIMVVP